MPPKSASNNLIASKTFSSAQPRSNAATRQEYAQLIDYMQNAINDKNDRKLFSLKTKMTWIKLMTK